MGKKSTAKDKVDLFGSADNDKPLEEGIGEFQSGAN
jgi:hypothetical protein